MSAERQNTGWMWRAGALAVLTLVLLPGCAGREKPATSPRAPAASSDGSNKTAEGNAAAEETKTAEETKAEKKAKRKALASLCHQGPSTEDEPLVDESRRRLQETFCRATLWFDGLLGGEPDVRNAQAVSGRVELSGLYIDGDDPEPKLRLRLKYDLPTLERRLNVFLGRDDEEQFIQDRREGVALRSSFFGLDGEEQWLAGLGYRPPGRWTQRLDFRVGGRLRSAPEIFVQGRWRRNVFLGESSVLRLRETVFWQNRDGFGSTTNVALERLLSPKVLARWDTVGTFSQATQGLEWRSASLLYRDLKSTSAIAAEVFVRGATRREIQLREYGVRGIYRRPLRRHLFGEVILGYSWPRQRADEPRQGSTSFGLGIELHFGHDPY